MCTVICVGHTAHTVHYTAYCTVRADGRYALRLSLPLPIRYLQIVDTTRYDWIWEYSTSWRSYLDLDDPFRMLWPVSTVVPNYKLCSTGRQLLSQRRAVMRCFRYAYPAWPFVRVGIVGSWSRRLSWTLVACGSVARSFGGRALGAQAGASRATAAAVPSCPRSARVAR